MNGTIEGASYEKLLAGSYDGTGTTVHLATGSDTVGKELFIAAKDAASMEVVTAYESGRFNRSAIKTTVDLSSFEPELRRQGNKIDGGAVSDKRE